ncbi:MAG: Lipopolysaccharide biosynthesis protein [Thermoanaerobacterales bacterium 50_218]|nr:MAG: Lipopolysaccharide biosynthesis protein [Thermoanaerobacterales bacterium 50_218]
MEFEKKTGNEQAIDSKPIPAYPPYEDEIDLRDIVLTLWKHRTLIAAVFLAAVLTSGVLSFFVLSPVYEVKAAISLGYLPSIGENPIHPLYTSPSYAREVLLSDDLLREVISGLNLEVQPAEFEAFKESIEVEPVKDTNMLRLTIETEDPAEGQRILNKMIEIFRSRSREQFQRQRELVEGELQRIASDLAELEQHIEATKETLAKLEGVGNSTVVELQRARLLDALSRFEEQRQGLLEKQALRLQELHGIEGIQVVESPHLPENPVRPRKVLNITVAGVLGLMVGVFAAFGVEYFRNNPLLSNTE